MKRPNKILTCSILTLILSVIVHTGTALCLSPEEIFNWVANELEIKNDYPMPEIRIVPKEELQTVFRQGNEKSLKRWAGMYGDETANEIMDQYLKEVIGLFNPKAKVIYVGSFMEPCKRESIIAHEFTHFFQVMENGTPDLGSGDADAVRLFQEMKASKVENEFKKTFCVSTGN